MDLMSKKDAEAIRKNAEFDAMTPEGKIAELQRQLREERVLTAELECHSTSLQNDINHKNSLIGNLKGQLEAAKAKCDDFVGKFSMADHKREMLKTQLHNTELQWRCEREGKDARITELCAELNAAHTRIDELEAELEATNARIKELELKHGAD
jgi:chromosome segregation ATPase